MLDAFDRITSLQKFTKELIKLYVKFFQRILKKAYFTLLKFIDSSVVVVGVELISDVSSVVVVIVVGVIGVVVAMVVDVMVGDVVAMAVGVMVGVGVGVVVVVVVVTNSNKLRFADVVVSVFSSIFF